MLELENRAMGDAGAARKLLDATRPVDCAREQRETDDEE
jgi:hypothetical protein